MVISAFHTDHFCLFCLMLYQTGLLLLIQFLALYKTVRYIFTERN